MEKKILMLLGLICGALIMLFTSNIFTYHGANSNDVKKTIFLKGDKMYRFVPNVLEKEK